MRITAGFRSGAVVLTLLSTLTMMTACGDTPTGSATPTATPGGAQATPLASGSAVPTPSSVVLDACTAVKIGTLSVAAGAGLSAPTGHSVSSGPFASTTCTFSVAGNGSLTVTIFTGTADFATIVQAGAGSYKDPATALNAVGDVAEFYYGTGNPSNSSALVAKKGSRVVNVELLEPGLSALDAQTYCSAVAKLLLAV